MKTPADGPGVPPNPGEVAVEKKSINHELWQACAGPLVNLPAAGTHVVYFPQGHSEQVAASMKKDVDAQIPNYPNLPSKLLCLLHNVTLHADPETDEVYAQMTLQPVPSFDKEALLRSDLSIKANKPQMDFFCKTLTASDTSTHGGFSVPRRAAEKIFPPLDFSMQPPAQELVARDLHDHVWTFRHIYRGQPKRHLLTTGWSLFVSGKRLFAGDSVLFIRDEKQQLLLGIRRANRQPTNLSSSVLSSDSMHIGILAAAAHAAANNSPFTVFYNPRASPSEFVIPLAKYYKAVCGNQISLGMRFRMMFETEESGTRRYMGTITGISDLDPIRWKNSQWRNFQVGWDESTAGERRNRVSIWEIEPVTAPFFICPTPPFFRSKRPRQPGMPDDEYSDLDNLFKRTMPSFGDDMCMKDPGLNLVQWMNMQQKPSLANPLQPNYLTSLSGSVLPNFGGADVSRQFGLSPAQILTQNNLQFNGQSPTQQGQQLDQLHKLPLNTLSPLTSLMQPQPQPQPQQQQQQQQQHQHQQQLSELSQNLPLNQIQAQYNTLVQPQSILQQHPSSIQNQNHHLHKNLPQNTFPQEPQQQQKLQQQQQQQQYHHHPHQQQQQQQQTMSSNNNQQRILMPTQLPDQEVSQQLQMPENQIQLLQKLHQQQQSFFAQQAAQQLKHSPFSQRQDQQKPLLDVSQTFSRSMATSQIAEMPLTAAVSLPQSQPMAPQQLTSQGNFRFSNLSQQSKLQQLPGVVVSGQVATTALPTDQLSTAGSSLLTGAAGGGQSGVTDDIPSCSTSPSMNNCQNIVPSLINCRAFQNNTSDEVGQSSATLMSGSCLETVSENVNLVRTLQHKTDIKPSLNISKNWNQGFLTPQTYLNVAGAQMDCLDSSSSATSACLSQNDVHLHQNTSQLSFDSQPISFRDTIQDGEVQDNQKMDLPFGANMDNHLGMSSMIPEPLITKGIMGSGNDLSNNLSSRGVLSGYENPKDTQPELSSSMVSQSFGVPDMAFNSIDSTINESSLVKRGVWVPPSQFQRMRTYTKVYKRGAVGRSIDITAYSGYEELKQDLARRFGIEGQLEGRQRIGWKLVYVDHENDVLLVGDDPWEEFVNCVRCIKILSPQEVQQMSLDGDIGNNVLLNQACSSSDGGNV